MKYKELQVGDWYKYKDNYYIYTQYLNGANISINLATGIICLPLKENIEVDFCPSFKVSNPNVFVGLIKNAPKRSYIAKHRRKTIFYKTLYPFS